MGKQAVSALKQAILNELCVELTDFALKKAPLAQCDLQAGLFFLWDGSGVYFTT